MNQALSPMASAAPKGRASGGATHEAQESVRYEHLNDNGKTTNRKRNWRDTATAAQYATILEHLKPCSKPMHTHALRRLGVMQPAARTKELRERFGYPIKRVALVTIYDDWGFAHRNVAMYAMLCSDSEGSAS